MIYDMVKDITILVIFCLHLLKMWALFIVQKHAMFIIYGFDFVRDEYIRHVIFICENED